MNASRRNLDVGPSAYSQVITSETLLYFPLFRRELCMDALRGA